MGSSKNRKVEVELTYVRNTPKDTCYIVRMPGGRTKDVIFLPCSIVERDGHIFKMPEWLAIEKGIDNLVKD